MFNYQFHSGIFGLTSGGKTYFSKELFYHSDYFSIFLNTNQENFSSSVKTVNEFNRKDFLLNKKIVLDKVNDTTINHTLEELETLALKLPNDRTIIFNLYVDEAQMLISLTDKNELLSFIKRAYRLHTSVFVIAQRAQEISKKVFSQLKQFAVFKITTNDEIYMRKKILPTLQFPQEERVFTLCTNYGQSEFMRLSK